MAEKQDQKEQAAQAEDSQEKSILDQIIEDGKMARDESQKAYAKDLIGEFVGQIMEGTMTVAKDTKAMINARSSQNVL